MLKDRLTNVHVSNMEVMLTPIELKTEFPVSEKCLEFISETRQVISDILKGNDKRFLVICGPCSIHDTDAAIDYAKRLKKLQNELSDRVFIVMRAYFEKPRTTVGWKGLINDPHIDGSFDIVEGLRKARSVLLDILELEVPLATEALDPISPQYMADLFSWSAIGARTTESQTHREMSSGLSMPVGFKNGTDGGLMVAINAIESSASPHSFMGINQDGQVSVITTEGNPDTHIILRGGATSNYDAISVAECELEMKKNSVNPSIMIDCSHANSRKDYRRQSLVAMDVVHQIEEGNQSIIGIMLESNINEGNQNIVSGEKLKYGVSITDACISFDDTEKLLKRIYKNLYDILPVR
ncbi:MAG: 3-deoxy-7-phosphoheptulonate synthase [Deltaproteobacteria bacterium]|nr:3-deoxy-7-phosphoheptulonate synthase [Deltaproteobacteria bacterium]